MRNTGLKISEIAFGAWPIAGMTSPGVTEDESLAAIRACFEVGINHLDTAYMYGSDGQSEKLIAKALGNRRGEMVIATKGGLHWGPDKEQVYDARPETLRRECEESLRRLADRSRGTLLSARARPEHAGGRIGRRNQAADGRRQSARGGRVECERRAA